MRNSQACEIDQYAPMATIRHDIQTEQQLDLHLSDSERVAIHSACRMSGLDLDSYYRWYQQKSTISSNWHSLTAIHFSKPSVALIAPTIRQSMKGSRATEEL